MTETAQRTPSAEDAIPEAVPGAAPDEQAEPEFRLDQKAAATDSGPCQKRVEVTITRASLDELREKVELAMVQDVVLPGFRPGRVPRKLMVRRFAEQIAAEFKKQVLGHSLDQLQTDLELDVVNSPDIDIEKIEIPAEGDFSYTFVVEVRPKFDLPDLATLTLRLPQHEVTEAEIDRQIQNLLANNAPLMSTDDPAKTDDVITAELEFLIGGAVVGSTAGGRQLRLRPVLQFLDASIEKFDVALAGVRPDMVREVKVRISDEAERIDLRGEEAVVRFTIRDVLRPQVPSLTPEILRDLKSPNEEALRGRVRMILENQGRLAQRRVARAQLVEGVDAATGWQLPEGMVTRQVQNALHRERLELREAGYTDEQILAREAKLRQQQITSTRQALKEHFLLDKILQDYKIQLEPNEVDDAILQIATQNGDSARKVRLRLQKEGLFESLLAELAEAKAVTFLMSKAKIEHISAPAAGEDRMEGINISVCGARNAPEAQAAV